MSIQSAITAVATWLRSVYSESDGSGSSTRFHIGLIIVFTIAVGIAFAVHVVHGHMTVSDYNAYLGAATLFLTSVGGFLYGINKAADVLSNKQQNGQ